MEIWLKTSQICEENKILLWHICFQSTARSLSAFGPLFLYVAYRDNCFQNFLDKVKSFPFIKMYTIKNNVSLQIMWVVQYSTFVIYVCQSITNVVEFTHSPISEQTLWRYNVIWFSEIHGIERQNWWRSQIHYCNSPFSYANNLGSLLCKTIYSSQTNMFYM